MAARSIGNRGEEMAVYYLERWGYEIIERNFYVRGGEIDIICKKDGVYFFVEVKFRRSDTYGHPLECIDDQKKGRLERAMQEYVYRNSLDLDNVGLRLFAILEMDYERKLYFVDIE